MIADVVVVPITDEQLSDVLPVIHRARLGNTARIMRADRGSIQGQLRRAGIPTANAPERVLTSDRLLVVGAAARSPLAAMLALQHGARAAWIVTPRGFWHAVDEGVTAGSPAATPPPMSPTAPAPPMNDEAGHHPL